MSAIDVSTPLAGESSNGGASRMRETRLWLYNLWWAYKQRNQDGSVTFDPGTASGGLNVPSAAPGVPEVGDFYITSSGLLYSYKSGPTKQLCGDFASGSVMIFRQATTPTGWTRDAAQLTGSALRYVTAGAPGSGGTTDISSTLVHNNFTSFNQKGGNDTNETYLNDGAGPPNPGAGYADPHQALKYYDVLIASKTS